MYELDPSPQNNPSVNKAELPDILYELLTKTLALYVQRSRFNELWGARC